MNGKIERLYPTVFGLASAVLYLLFLRTERLPEATKDLFNAAITVAAITVGFLVTAQSILLDRDDGTIAKQLKAIGAWSSLLGYFRSATWLAFLAAGFSAVLLFLVDPKNPARWHPWIFAVWVFLVALAAGAGHRVIAIFFKLVHDKRA